jgi:UPF0489 domain
MEWNKNTDCRWYDIPQYLKVWKGNNAHLIPEDFSLLRTRGLRVAPSIFGDDSLIQIGSEIAFSASEYEKRIDGYGLEYFVEGYIFGNTLIEGAIFDNHNHALYYWCKYLLNQGISLANSPKIPVVHIDMHSDLWTNNSSFNVTCLQGETQSILTYVADFVNMSCNVGNYIDPAIRAGIIGDVIRIEGEYDLQEKGGRVLESPFFLNIDLDFFAEDLDDVDFTLKKRVIHHYLQQKPFVTVATSPFFIPPEKALNAFRRVFFDAE